MTNQLHAQTLGEQVRKDFPLFEALAEQGETLAYLDNAATTQRPFSVLEAEEVFYCTANGNPNRSGHRLAKAATNAFELARRDVAGFFGAQPDEILFTGGATHALNMAAFSLGATRLHEGDEVVVSLLEHHSNLLPWQAVTRQKDAHLVYLVPDQQGVISNEEIDRVIGPKTRVVAITHASNVLGVMPPIDRITQAAHSVGAVVVLDCAQSAAHQSINVGTLGVDVAAFAAHKMYGPMGIGALYARRELLAEMPPFHRGGGMVVDVFEQTATFALAPTGFEAGTQNVAGAVGFAQACRFLRTIGEEVKEQHESLLMQQMLTGLCAIPSVKLYGSPCADTRSHCGIVSFTLRGTDTAIVDLMLDKRGVAIRAGTHCAQPILRHLGVSATARASLGIYNTKADINQFLEAVEAAPLEGMTFEAALLL